MDANPTAVVLASSSAFGGTGLAPGDRRGHDRGATSQARGRQARGDLREGATMDEADISSAFAFVQPERNRAECDFDTALEILLAE